MEASDAVLVASGTASLEVALYKKPMVISYKVNWASYQIMRHMAYQPWIGLPNILARLPGAGTAAASGDPERWPMPCGISWKTMRTSSACCGAADMHQPAARYQPRSANAVARSSAPSPLTWQRGPLSSLKKEIPMPKLAPQTMALFDDHAGEIICGVDEAGRGPLAGPVFAAAVILDPARPVKGLRDSKKLSEAARDAGAGDQGVRAGLVHRLQRKQEIDELNILQASMLAMRRAVEALSTCPRWR
jgi:hypothetical protein